MNRVSISSLRFYGNHNLMITHSGCRGHWTRRGCCSIWQVSWERHPSIAHLQMMETNKKSEIKCQLRRSFVLNTHINVSNELANSASNRWCTVRIHEGCSTVPTADMRRLIGVCGWGCCQVFIKVKTHFSADRTVLIKWKTDSRKSIPGTRFTVWQQEHLTLFAPRVYISIVRQPPHTMWAMSIPKWAVFRTQTSHKM